MYEDERGNNQTEVPDMRKRKKVIWPWKTPRGNSRVTITNEKGKTPKICAYYCWGRFEVTIQGWVPFLPHTLPRGAIHHLANFHRRYLQYAKNNMRGAIFGISADMIGKGCENNLQMSKIS